YDTRTSHEVGREGLRPSSIKGVWRWWARIFVSAAICRKFQYTSFVDLEGADAVVARILGTTRGEASSSKYQLIIEDLQVRYIELSNYKEVARVKLLGLGRRDIIGDRVVEPGSTFSVDLYKLRKASEAEDAFAISSLLVALTFGGIGKATSRGFGKLAVTQVNCNIGSVKELYSELEKLNKSEILKETFHEKAEKIIEKIFESCINLASPLVENVNVSAQHRYPLIETPVSNYYRVRVPNLLFDGDVDVLEAIGKTTLKLNWKKSLGMNIRSSGRNIDTWILGLPRSQTPRFKEPANLAALVDLEKKLKEGLENQLKTVKLSRGIVGCENADKILRKIRKIERDEERRYEVPTGYFNCCKKYDALVRRRSPIIFVPIKLSNGEYKGKYYVAIIGFITADWDRVSLIHLGFNWNYPHYFKVTFRPTQLNDVKRAFNTALDNVVKMIERSR
ncbi:MAG: type III-B CRISPR module RAMP protein Cmr1, partial [Thermofilaceae archaeon]